MNMTREQWQAIEDNASQRVQALFGREQYTVPDRFEDLVASQPNRPALIYADQQFSYAQMDQQASRYAAIALKCGLKKGDVASIMIENRPEFLFAWLGMMKIGVVAALINTEAKKMAVSHAVSIVDSKLVIVGAECWANYMSGDSLPEKYQTVFIPEPDVVEVELASNVIQMTDQLNVAALGECLSHRAGVNVLDPCCYIFTSGTTGLPKATRIAHGKLMAVGEITLARSSINQDDVFYCVLPLFHGAALMSQYSTVLACGGLMVLRRKFSASAFWKDVKKHGITVFQYIGEVCRYLVNTKPVLEEKNHTLKVIMGSGIGLDVWLKFIDRFGDQIQIMEGWGSTESNCSTINLDNTPGSCGRIPFKEKSSMRLIKYNLETEQYLRDDNGFYLECDVDEPGEAIGCIHRGDGTVVAPFDGYTDTAESSKKLLRDVFEKGDCWFRSGDMLKRDADDYYYFVDRMGDTFRWKAENVSTTEVAQQLSSYGDTELINVYGVKVPGCEGRAGMAALLMQDGKKFDPARFYGCATQSLPHYAVPLFVRVNKQVDTTPSYKLKKVNLRAEGYDPARFSDDLYLLDHNNQSYSLYSAKLLETMDIQPFIADQ